MRFDGKQWAVIAGSVAIAVVIDWLLWFIIMKHPSEIDLLFHALTILCLAAAFVHIGDRLLKTEIYR
jgi:phosphate starvation-inducible membrane PsiE